MYNLMMANMMAETCSSNSYPPSLAIDTKYSCV